MGPGKQGPLRDETGVWKRVVVGAEGKRISLKGIWTFIRQTNVARSKGEEGRELRERLGRRLWAACGVRAAPTAASRRHGLSAWNAWKRGGTLVVAHLPHRVVQFGNERRAAELVEMEKEIETEEVEMGRSATQFDEGLWVDNQARQLREDGGLVSGEGGLGVLGQFFWNAREAMGAVPVADGASMGDEERRGWKGRTFVCPRATGDLWEKLRPIVRRWRVQAVTGRSTGAIRSAATRWPRQWDGERRYTMGERCQWPWRQEVMIVRSWRSSWRSSTCLRRKDSRG